MGHYKMRSRVCPSVRQPVACIDLTQERKGPGSPKLAGWKQAHHTSNPRTYVLSCCNAVSESDVEDQLLLLSSLAHLQNLDSCPSVSACKWYPFDSKQLKSKVTITRFPTENLTMKFRRDHPQQGRQIEVGHQRFAFFKRHLFVSWKRCEIGPQLLQNANRK